MKILAIETSCDDTGISVLEVFGKDKFKVLSNIVSSQIEIHKKYGGVFPTMAKREHQKNSVPVLKEALSEAGLLSSVKTQNKINLEKLEKILEKEPELLKKVVVFLKKYKKPEVDFIAVTNGPGLEPCLWVGVNFARALSYIWNIPIIPVNHIESHILVNCFKNKNILLPALALVVSGGHTQLILIKKIGSYKIIGETRDDAAGECFDKAAKILKLDYPGGPVISKLAEKSLADSMSQFLPRPMINTKDYDFSFSGLKTAILYHHQKQKKSIQKNKQYIADMCAEIQQSIVDVLIKKTIQAGKDYNIKTIILGGGVSANHELKTQLFIKIKQEMPNVDFLFPENDLSTDNGLMVAISGFYNKKNTVAWKLIQADGNLRIGKK